MLAGSAVVRSGIWGSILCLLFFASSVLAQTDSPESEYRKAIRVDTEIHPLAAEPFGESVSLYDGSLSFHVTDITLPGTGPAITISRTFKADGDVVLRQGTAAFGDWDLDLPQLETLTSNASTIIAGPPQIGWLVDSTARTDRCTNFGLPPEMRHGAPGSDTIPAEKWWNDGYQLKIPGAGSQDVLKRSPTSPAAPQMAGLNFVALTKDNWHLACLAATANGEPGEGFLAVGPDGTKYWLDELVYQPARGYIILRNLGYMRATKIQDRFGNTVTYSYSGGKLSFVDASDGRHVAIAYNTNGQVSTITAGSRVWTYQYTSTSTGSSLASVTLPDPNQVWTYQFADLAYEVKSSMPASPTDCADPSAPDPSVTIIGTSTAPSGLQATFEAHPVQHARSDVPEACDTSGLVTPARMYELRPRLFNNLALTRKTFTGPGVSYEWTYSYPLATASWHQQCGACDFTSHSDVKDPQGNFTRYTFSNRFDETEGLPLKVEKHQGALTDAIVETDTSLYLPGTTGPWPAQYGYNFTVNLNDAKLTEKASLAAKTVARGADTFNWQALSFDARARPLQVSRSSNAPGQTAITEATTYYDDLTHWVLGQVQAVDNVSQSPNENELRNTFDPATALLTARSRFGEPVMSYTWDAAGQLASFTDPLGHKTSLPLYHRGIPNEIDFADGTVEKLAVDDYAEITSITNQLGAMTSYAYDGVGRVTSVTYPAGDEQAWSSEQITYAPEAASHGLAAGHWRRTVTLGSKVTTTWFDALMRPVLAQISGGGVMVTSGTGYDFQGRTTFQAFPVSGDGNVGALTNGLSTTYDPIGRLTGSVQSSELGDLTTVTSYPSGARKQVTDSRGGVTTTAYQVFDTPTLDKPVSVTGPEGVSQTIVRDLYGNPKSITQGGLTRWIYYDSFKRPCRTVNPESASDVMGYDAADNLVWSASGQSISGTDCSQELVASAARTTRTYDTLNRITGIAYPSPTVGTSMSYTWTGKPLETTTGGAVWQYVYNKRDMLTDETLGIDGFSWTAHYAHDANGELASARYPSGMAVAYSPDALGRPTGAGAFASGAQYFPDGALETVTLGNGVNFVATENARKLVANFSYVGANGPVVSEDLTYDANGNMTKVSDVAGAGQRNKDLTYDGLNRLKSAVALSLWGSESYSYDALNNIASLTANGILRTYSYDETNLLSQIVQQGSPPSSFAYDPRGNTISRNGSTLIFDDANRLVQSVGTDAYTYDADGRRVKKVAVGGAATYYAYGQSGLLLWQFDPGTAKETDYVYLGKRLVASTVNSSIPASAPVLSGPATGQVNTAYTLSWTAVTGAATYLLQEQVNGAAFGQVTNLNELSQATSHSGPATFGYRVQACNDAGCGPWSNVVNVVVQPPPSAPSAPASASAVLSADTSTITVNWAATADTTSYVAQQQLNGGAWQALYSGTATSTALGGLSEGTYGFQVHSCNANGCSAWTPAGTVSVTHLAIAPAAISVPATSTGPLAIGWSVGAYATYYSLEQSVNGGAWINIINPTANSWSTTLTSSGSYAYRVRSCNAHGCSVGYSPTGTTSATIAPTAAPAITVPGTSNTGAYSVSWSGVSGAGSYTLQEQTNGGAFGTVQSNAATSWSTSGKANGTYGYRVQACNAGGCGPFSSTGTISVALVPAQPTGAVIHDVVVNPKKENRTMTWNQVATATSYQILDHTSNHVVYNNVYNSAGFLLETGAAGLLPLHDFQIRACNATGCSAYFSPPETQ